MRRSPVVGYVILLVGLVVVFYIYGARQNRNTATIARLTRLEHALARQNEVQGRANVEAHRLSCLDRQDTWDLADRLIRYATVAGPERNALEGLIGGRPEWDVLREACVKRTA